MSKRPKSKELISSSDSDNGVDDKKVGFTIAYWESTCSPDPMGSGLTPTVKLDVQLSVISDVGTTKCGHTRGSKRALFNRHSFSVC